MSQSTQDILPEERIPPTTLGRLMGLLVLVGMIVVGVNFVAARALQRLPVNRGYALAHGKWQLMDRALEAKQKIDVLIVGDSSSNQGLSPQVIRDVTGMAAMNFGVVAEALTADPVWTADRFFEESAEFGHPPRTILWMHVYDVWSRVDKNDRRLRGISASLPPTAWPYISRGPRVKFTPRDLWFMQQLPLYFQNQSLANLVRRPFASIEEAHRFRFDDAGFTSETTPDPALVRRDTKNHMQLARSTDSFSPTTLSRRSIDSMCQLADKYHAALWIVQSPLNRTLWQDPVFRKRWYEVRNDLQKAVARYPHVRVTFEEPMLFDDERMQNCDHVLADAAMEFTREVISRTGLAAPATQPTNPE